MTRQETVSILAILRAAFPSFYKGMERKDLEGIVSLWNDMFRDDAANVVAGAVKGPHRHKNHRIPPYHRGGQGARPAHYTAPGNDRAGGMGAHLQGPAK